MVKSSGCDPDDLGSIPSPHPTEIGHGDQAASKPAGERSIRSSPAYPVSLWLATWPITTRRVFDSLDRDFASPVDRDGRLLSDLERVRFSSG